MNINRELLRQIDKEIDYMAHQVSNSPSSTTDVLSLRMPKSVLAILKRRVGIKNNAEICQICGHIFGLAERFFTFSFRNEYGCGMNICKKCLSEAVQQVEAETAPMF